MSEITEQGKERFKIWKANRDSAAGMMVTEKTAIMAGDKWNFFAADNSGISLIGRGITFGCTSESIHRGGVFQEMNDFVRMIPQTLVTPNSNQTPYPPVGFPVSIMRDLPMFLAMISNVEIPGV